MIAFKFIRLGSAPRSESNFGPTSDAVPFGRLLMAWPARLRQTNCQGPESGKPFYAKHCEAETFDAFRIRGSCFDHLDQRGSSQAPALQVGTFYMPAPPSCGGHTWCGSSADVVMTRRGLKVTRSTDDELVFGVGSNVSVAITCVSIGDQSFATLVAASSDSSLAEETRNAVRSDMVGGKCL